MTTDTDLVADVLDVLHPAFESVKGDWKAVLRTASGDPAPVPSDHRRRRHLLRRWLQSRRSPLLVLAAIVSAAALAGVAIAGGIGAFNGIGATQHARTPADVVDPATAAFMNGKGCAMHSAVPATNCMPGIAGLLLDTTRGVGQLPSGQKVYAVATTHNDLCFIVGPPGPEWGCDELLNQSHPTTVFTYANDPRSPVTSFGITLDGVASVSFEMNGSQVNVPVSNDLWTYQWAQGVPPDIFPLEAHFSDGTTAEVNY